jgi:hypothetical protein
MHPAKRTQGYDQIGAQRPTTDGEVATQEADPFNRHLGLACSGYGTRLRQGDPSSVAKWDSMGRTLPDTSMA